MIPDEFALTGYRGFESRQTIALRPLTLLYGRNNAGKSALLRALPLLSDSIAQMGSDVLAVASPAARGAGFRDLSFDGRPEGFTVEWWWALLRRRVRIEFRLFPDWGRIVVQRFAIEEDASGDAEQARPVLVATWTPRREERESPKLSYEIQIAGQPTLHARANFRGAVPQFDGEIGAHPEFVAATALLRSLGSQVQWIEAARDRPGRVLPEPPGPRWRLDPGGGDAVLAMRSIPSILSPISAWVERHARRRIALSDAGPGTFFAAAEAPGGDRTPRSVADLGEGMLQVLPVLAAMELSRRHRDGGAAVLAVEEPESNLHPRLQSELALDFCKLAAMDDPPRVVIETHSEHFFTGVQLAVLRGDLPRDRVAVYWVRQDDEGISHATAVTFDDEMRVLGGWPESAFDDAVELAERVIDARRRRSR